MRFIFIGRLIFCLIIFLFAIWVLLQIKISDKFDREIVLHMDQKIEENQKITEEKITFG